MATDPETVDKSDEEPATHGHRPLWGVLKRDAVPGLACSVDALKNHEADTGCNLEKADSSEMSLLFRTSKASNMY